ncbi:hypothetical protein KSP39_PZI014155 [Platanthera zijinensis]|uniref:Uncharacterized protein n=1 Tax=Platanthera zijinensis TaxID=2320716 RepID=A0AAP0BDT3_9ASPA
MDAVQPGWLVKFFKGIDSMQVKEMQEDLAKHSRHFLPHPAQPLGPEDFAWRMVCSRTFCLICFI